MNKCLLLTAAFGTLSAGFSSALAQDRQGAMHDLEIHGNFEIYAQTYRKDSLIGANIVPEKSGANSFANFIATKGDFSAGVRIESYLPPIQGFDLRYASQPVGVAYRYATYKKDNLELTLGNFYEQFGNGMILRTYESRALGYDNVFDGARVRYMPLKGLYLKGLLAKQRYYWIKSDGTVRGLDAEWAINESFEKFNSSAFRITIGGSAVSKFQAQSASNLDFPENVAAFSGRIQTSYKNFSLLGEYSYKMNDPSVDNHYIYREGQGLFLSATYSTKGFGINISAKSIDNMSFRSDREARQNDVFINYLPALSRQHTYNLCATLYPYATQPNGEIGLQGDIIFRLKKDTWYGGKYGTTIQGNVSIINGHDTSHISSVLALDKQEYLPNDPHRIGYKTSLFSWGKSVYYRDYNIEIDRKFSKNFKLKTTYAYFVYNIDLIQGKTYGTNVYAHVGVLDGLYKLAKKHSVRVEAQHMWTKQDHGNWAFAQIEYGYSPHWFVTVLNQYNYGNKTPILRLHYPTAQIAYINKGNRISISYGRQRAGIFCVGGVCRVVPAANGITLSITSSF